MAVVASVNLGVLRAVGGTSARSGIGKVPAPGPVVLSAPGPGASGVAGDAVGNAKHHGGPDQAVYAYAREDLDWWEGELGRGLAPGVFGENLTTEGLEVTQARLGERWRVGAEAVLEVTAPRIPCRTFAAVMGEPAWAKRFSRAARPGAYLRVVAPGTVRAGDPIVLVSRPDHPVTLEEAFRALTTEPERLPGLLAAGPHLIDPLARRARGRAGRVSLDNGARG